MRILHVIDSLGTGGAQRLIVDMAPIQKELGHSVSVLELVESKESYLKDALLRFGIKTTHVSNRISVYNPLLVFKIIPYLSKYDVIHVHLFPALYWVAFAKFLSFSKTPLFYTEHCTTNRRRDKWILRIFDRFAYRRYKSIIACSDKSKETFNETYPMIRIESIPNGINLASFNKTETIRRDLLFEITEPCFITTMVSRFNYIDGFYHKRQDVLIRAMAELPEVFHLVLVGGHEDELGVIKAKELCEQYKVTSRVHFLYTRDDIPNILLGSDVIALSSDFEGLSLASIEGMASGKPFLASDVDGLREVVGGAGILVKPEDVAGFVESLQKLYNDRDYYELVAKRCKARASEYDVHKVVSDYLDVYSRFVQ